MKGFANNVIKPYEGVFIAGYVIFGVFLVGFIVALVYLKAVKGKPKFIKYDNNNGGNEEEERLP